MGALHGSIDPSLAADGSDPIAVCGGSLYASLVIDEVSSPVRDGAVGKGLPGLLGASERASERNQVERNQVLRQCENEKIMEPVRFVVFVL